MNIYPIYKELSAIDLPIEKIFLDPNNPRFVDADWEYVPDNMIDNEDLQKNIQLRLIRDFTAEKLVMNMEVNGYLPIDRVIVRKFAEDKYVVLEGNRRISAAKNIFMRYQQNPAIISEEIIDSIRRIPSLLYTGDNSEASWIFQGLRHITGVKEWSAFNKAKLLVELMEEEELSLTEVGSRFGLSAHGAGQWVRGYNAFKQAKEESDYVSEVNEKAFPFFQELFGNSNKLLRDWLSWDDVEKRVKNELNFNEFIGWIYPRSEEDLAEWKEESDLKGDFKRRLLVRGDDLRTLSFLLKESPQDFQFFRTSGNLEQAYSNALLKRYEEQSKQSENPVNKVFDVIQECIKVLDNIPFRILKDEETKQRFYNQIELLLKSIDYIKE